MLNVLTENGVFALHTVICEKPPQDPSWFYYSPLHCSIFSNRSMDVFMERFGFKYSLYSPIAKTWLLFKEKPVNAEARIATINKEFQSHYLFGKDGFVDYWK